MSKEDELKAAFEGIDNVLGSAFELEDSLEVVEQKTISKEIVEYEDSNGDILTEEEVRYLQTEIKGTVLSIDTVMDTLQSDLAIGSEARKFEVYATLATAKINAVNSLRDLKLAQKKLHIEERKTSLREKEKGDNVNNGTVVNFNGGMSFDDMRELSNQLKEVMGK